MSSDHFDEKTSAIQAKAWVAVCVLSSSLSLSPMALAQSSAEQTSSASADQSQQSPQKTVENAKRLPTVVIDSTELLSTRTSTLQSEGVYQLDEKALEAYGNVSGSMTDALSTLPNVQYSDQVDPTATLKPSSISIAGGRYYENNFSINGVSNNSLIDPAGGQANGVNDIPGHEQAIYYDLDQIESISIYDSNVPVEYGNFTGGVVDAKLKHPRERNKTKLSAFTTKADWVNYHIIYRPELLESASFTAPESPEYSRSRYVLSHERQLTDTQGIRIGVTHQTIETPLLMLLQTQQVEETSTNVSLTHGYESASGIRLLTNVGYAPYTKSSLEEDVKDSFYELKGGGLSVNSELILPFGEQEHTFTLGYNQTEESRTAPTDLRRWNNASTKNWGVQAGLPYSYEGGYGDLNKDQEKLSLNWKTQQSLSPYFSLRYGAQLARSESGFERPIDVAIYENAVVNTRIQCIGLDYDCAQKEQYFRTRKIYPSDKVSVSLLETAAFTELNYQRDRLDITLGARLDRDDFLENTNVAWRSRGVYSLNDEGSMAIVAGVNRYYGGPVLAYKLREAAKPYYTEYRGSYQNVIKDWEYDTDTGLFKYRFDDVKTPYSDEITLGWRGNLGSGVAEIKWLSRENSDEFSRTVSDPQPDGYTYYLMNNEGYSSYESVVVSWDGRVGRFNLGANVTWSETKSSNDTYDDAIDAATSTEMIWYDGAMHSLSSVSQLRKNFARPLVANAYISGDLGYGINATLKARFKGEYDTITRGVGRHNTGNIIEEDGQSYEESLVNYVDSTVPNTLLFDAKFNWSPLANKHVTLTAEVLNLLDDRTHAVNDAGEPGIEVGRTFWLGAQINF